MRDWIIEKRAAISIVTMAAVILIMFGYFLGNQSAQASVSYGKLVVKVGEGDKDDDGMPVEEAIASIYNRTEDMETKVSFLINYTHRDMVRNIENQYSILINTPKAAKRNEILKALDDWSSIPQDLKSYDLMVKYDFIKDYHKESLMTHGYIAVCGDGEV